MKGLKTIEILKSELLSAVSELFRGLVHGTEELVLDGLANVIMTTYLLARRLGYGYIRLDLKVQDRVRAHLQAGHDVERWYGDLSALHRHLRDGRKDHRLGQSPGAEGGPVQ